MAPAMSTHSTSTSVFGAVDKRQCFGPQAGALYVPIAPRPRLDTSSSQVTDPKPPTDVQAEE
jgi:hypothetical protein